VKTRTDRMLLIATAVFVGGLAIVAGMISFSHMRALALIRSWPSGAAADLGGCVVDMSMTGRSLCL
jgi:hypothetical protein